MSLQYIRNYYGLPKAKRGAKVKYKNHFGRVTSSYMGWLNIELKDGTKIKFIHPKDDELVYC